MRKNSLYMRKFVRDGKLVILPPPGGSPVGIYTQPSHLPPECAVNHPRASTWQNPPLPARLIPSLSQSRWGGGGRTGPTFDGLGAHHLLSRPTWIGACIARIGGGGVRRKWGNHLTAKNSAKDSYTLHQIPLLYDKNCPLDDLEDRDNAATQWAEIELK